MKPKVILYGNTNFFFVLKNLKEIKTCAKVVRRLEEVAFKLKQSFGFW